MPAQVAALFVRPDGPYPSRCIETYDVTRDARLYPGPYPVVAHPPCHLWVNLAAVNWKRYRRESPAWYPGGTDYGCFASALASVRRFGGVLEHPAGSHAWKAHGIPRPNSEGWLGNESRTNEWTCEVCQSEYGHLARKRTWLLCVSKEAPRSLRFGRGFGTHQIGWFDRKRPTLSKKLANVTPPEFADLLVSMAGSAN